MSVLLDNAMATASADISKIRDHVRAADVQILAKNPTLIELGHKTKAWAYVWTAAVMERTVKDFLVALITEINAQAVPMANLNRRLFSLLFDPHFASHEGSKKLLRFSKRTEMFTGLANSQTVQLNLSVLPLDGRTLRDEHFECMWQVFGFANPVLPTPTSAFALKELADSRNDVAHGHVNPIAFGRTKVPRDVINIIDRAEDVLLHMWTAVDNYLSMGAFRI